MLAISRKLSPSKISRYMVCMYDGKDISLWMTTRYTRFVCYQCLLFLVGHKLQRASLLPSESIQSVISFLNVLYILTTYTLIISQVQSVCACTRPSLLLDLTLKGPENEANKRLAQTVLLLTDTYIAITANVTSITIMIRIHVLCQCVVNRYVLTWMTCLVITTIDDDSCRTVTLNSCSITFRVGNWKAKDLASTIVYSTPTGRSCKDRQNWHMRMCQECAH